MTLQALIDATPTGGVLELPGDPLVMEHTVTVTRPMEIIPSGEWRWPTDGPAKNRRTRSLLRIDAAVELRPAHIRGPKTKPGYVSALEAQHGIFVAGPSGARVHEPDIADVHGDAIYFGMGTSTKTTRAPAPSDVEITDLTARNCGRMFVGIAAGTDLTIGVKYLDGCGRSAFDLEPNVAGRAPGAPDTLRQPGEDPHGPRFRVIDRVRIHGGEVRNYTFGYVAATGIGTVGSVLFEDQLIDEHRGMIGEAMQPGEVPLRGPIMFRRIHGETASDGGDQTGHEANYVLRNCDSIVWEDCTSGGVRGGARRDASWVRTKGNCSRIWVVGCEVPHDGDEIIHPEGVGAQVFNRRGGVPVAASFQGDCRLPRLPELPR